METNEFETAARQRKAIALTNVLSAAFDGEGIPESEVALFTPEQWALTAEAAGVRIPSEQTKALVRQSLRVREQLARKVDAGREAERAREQAETDALFSGLGR